MTHDAQQSQAPGRILNIADGGRTSGLFPLRRDGAGLFLLWPLLLLVAWPLFGLFTVGAAAVGALLGVVLFDWHRRHPSTLARRPPVEGTRQVQINIAEVHVGGDIAGLIFAAGSVVVVLVGLPGLWLVAAAALTCAACVAMALLAWHQRPRRMTRAIVN